MTPQKKWKGKCCWLGGTCFSTSFPPFYSPKKSKECFSEVYSYRKLAEQQEDFRSKGQESGPVGVLKYHPATRPPGACGRPGPSPCRDPPCRHPFTCCPCAGDSGPQALGSSSVLLCPCMHSRELETFDQSYSSEPASDPRCWVRLPARLQIFPLCCPASLSH